MAENLDPPELVSFKEPLITKSIPLDALSQLLIEKGIFTSDEFYARLKQVQTEYMSRKQRSDESYQGTKQELIGLPSMLQ